ncbi:methyltransferase domain-containing protein [Candidatus Daviesbacteria bacterium]|nr:methyltransferase domain-containing protein [Candidatus Daviesbacteria bacterium]
MKIIAYTVKGLEEVAKQEIQNLVREVNFVDLKPKRIVFETKYSKVLTDLKTVDDICLLLATGEISRVEDVLNIFRDINLKSAKEQIEQYRKVNNTFSVTFSLAKTKIKVEELQSSLSKVIGEDYNWEYTELDHSNFDIRVFIDNKELYVSVRLTEKPLFHRSYRTVSSKGGLRPSIANSMVKLATLGDKGIVVDNFCGSGTILAEAYLAGNDIFGGDIENMAVEATLQNLSNLGCKTESKIKRLDALKAPWKDKQFDFAVSNLPWDKQIEIKSVTDLYVGSLSEYARILKPDGRLCLLVSKPDLLIKHAKAFFPNKKIEKFQIGFLGQTPSIITII